jgi:hypothetical protein
LKRFLAHAHSTSDPKKGKLVQVGDGFNKNSGTNEPFKKFKKEEFVPVIDTLEQLKIEKFVQVRKTMNNRQIKECAKEVIMLGFRYDLGLLCNWGSQLHQHAHHFDIAKIHKDLKEFPDLIESLKNAYLE